MDRELQQAKEEQRKLVAFAESCKRSTHVWQQEYLRMLRFDGGQRSCIKILCEAATKSLEKLDMQSVQNALILDVIDELTTALSIAERFDLNSTRPTWSISEAESLDAFVWKADLDGIDVTIGADGKFTNAITQATWEGWHAGALLGCNQASREIREEWATRGTP